MLSFKVQKLLCSCFLFFKLPSNISCRKEWWFKVQLCVPNIPLFPSCSCVLLDQVCIMMKGFMKLVRVVRKSISSRWTSSHAHSTEIISSSHGMDRRSIELDREEQSQHTALMEVDPDSGTPSYLDDDMSRCYSPTMTSTYKVKMSKPSSTSSRIVHWPVPRCMM